MIDIEEFDGGFRVVDAAKNEVTIEIDDWEPGGEELEIGYDVTETVTGSGTEIRLPNAGILLDSSTLEDPQILNMNEEVNLPSGEHHFRLAASITVFVKVDSPSTVIAKNSPESITISSRSRIQFILGFEEYDNYPGEQISIPPSVEGAVAAINTCASRHATETPDRSFPSERPRLPSVQVEATESLDKEGMSDQGESVLFRIPPSFDFLYPLAPLAYYTGGRISLERRTKPVLELPSHVHTFPSDSRFPEEVAGLLRRIFYLDCLIREAGPRRLGIRELELLEALSIDIHKVFDFGMVDRIHAYLDVPFETIDSALPDWPLGIYLDPTVENLPAIPYLLEKLSFVFPPKSAPVDEETLVERSLGDFYRSSVDSMTPEKPITIRSTEANRTQVQGWLASGAPVDAFKCLPEAISNDREYLVPSSEPIKVKLVLNDGAMELERSNALQIYRDRSEELSIEFDVLEDANVEELARAIESHSDFLHYIGHCDPSGFRCANGNLSADQLSRSRSRTFFLNACGSYGEGIELIKRGSVAGVVTLGDVIDAQAAKVGINFARTYMYGYTIERALFHTRGQAIMNQQYTILGDGTHVLTQGDSILPAVGQITPLGDETYSVKLDGTPVNLNGSVILPYADFLPSLAGNDHKSHLNKEELYQWIPTTNDPLIYDGKFYWPEELQEELF